MKQLLLDVLAAPAPSLENYVAGPNSEALAALQSLEGGRAVYLWGPAGCGRTHLLRACTDTPLAVYVDAATPLPELLALANPEDPAHPPARIAIDDLHRMDAPRLACVFAIYNWWRESAAADSALSLIVAGDLAPAQMPLREDLRTRLGWDLVFRLDALSDSDKIAALTRRAASRGWQPSPEVLNWVLTHYERDMRRLSTLLDALDNYSLETKRPITVPLLRAMLAEQPAPLTPNQTYSSQS
jgi:DnaA family protein